MAAQQQGQGSSDDDLMTSWPELVGTPGYIAYETIQKDRPDVYIQILVLSTYFPPPFYDDKRVRLFVHPDFDVKVASTPVVG